MSIEYPKRNTSDILLQLILRKTASMMKDNAGVKPTRGNKK